MRYKQTLLVVLFLTTSLIVSATEFYITTADLNVRTGAGKAYAVSFTIQKGNEVEILSKNGGWYQIRYFGKTGYAHSKYLKSTSDTKFDKQQSNESNSTNGTLLVLGLVVLIWLFPILAIISSNKTTSGEKIAWILAVLFISWFAWIFYMLLAPIKKKE